MTDELSRSARRLLGELRSTEAYVRVVAARVLPYASMMRMERRAADRCAELLAAAGVAPGGPVPQPVPVRARPARRSPPGAARTSRSPTPGPTAAPRVAASVPTPHPPSPRAPTDTRPTAPRAPTMNTAPQVEDLDDQLTVAAPPPASRMRPAGSGPAAPRPAPRATTREVATTASASPPRPGPREQSPEPSSLVSFQSSEPEAPPTVTYGADGVVTDSPEPATEASVPAPAVPEAPKKPEPPAVSAQVKLEPTPAGPSQSRINAPATSGLYGGAVPSVRGADTMRPRAAAIQLNASGTGGKVMLDEEDEPIEVGEADHEFEDGAPGFTVALHEDEDEVEELIEEPPPMPEPAMPPEIPPPTEEEIASLLSQAQSVAATGNLHGAAQLYSDLIDMSGDHARAHISRGRLYLDLGDYSRAMSDFMVAEDLAPDDPETHVAIGDLYFHRKEYRRAIDHFSSALEVSPEHAMAYCRRGICHYYRKNYRVALEDLLRAKDLQPDIPNITAYVTRARKKASARRA